MIYNPYLIEYIDLVKSGEIEVCEDQKKLVKLVEDAFSNEDLIIDEERLIKYMEYQKYFPFELFPWEKFLFTLHICVFRRDGSVRWPELLIMVGRGAGKNGYEAFEDFCLMSPTHGVREYHIDSCANSERQATATFDYLYALLDRPTKPEYEAALKKNFRWNKTEIENIKTGSIYRYYTASPRAKDGLKTGKAHFDEVHAFQNRQNIQVFETGLGKKPYPRITYTTTNGEINGLVLDEMLELSEDILNGKEPDNGFLPFICRLDDKAEVHNEKNWSKANPSFPYLPHLQEEMRREYVKYKRNPAQNTQFMTKRMNIRELPENMLVAVWDDIKAANEKTPDLTGKTCILGLDYALSTDFISAFLLFKIEGIYYGINHSWFCEASRHKWRIKPLDSFRARPDLVTFVDDVEIHPEIISEWVAQQKAVYNISALALDFYRWSFVSKELEKLGFDPQNKELVKLVRPSDLMLCQPVISSAFVNRIIKWGDNPVMSWFTNNTQLVPAPNNCYKFDKIEGQSRKNDGFMALAAAMTRAETLDDTTPEFMPTLVF